MFKLSALEPLLESNTKRGARSSHHQKPQKDRKPGDSPGKKATNNSPDRPLPYALSTQDWQAQAEQLTQGVNAPSYRSLAVYAQVKLTEALDKCDQASPPRLAEDDTVLPDRLRTAVCCQLLAELCGMCGAFAPVLRTIQQELVKAIYSDYYVSDSGRLHFCQVPYFTAVERLEGEKQHMLREKEVFRKTLLKRQDEIAHIEEHIGELTGALHSSQANASELEAKLHQAGQVEAQAKLEVAAAREELKRVRKEHLKLKDEWETLRALYDTVKAKPERIQARCDEQMAKMKEKVAKYKAEALAAQELAGSRAPQEELQAALDRCQALEIAVMQQQRQLDEQARSCTPRPAWQQLAPADFAAGDAHTGELVARLFAERELAAAQQAEAAQLSQQLAEAQAVLAPEPPPAPIQLVIFRRGSDPGGSGAQAGRQVDCAESLGLEPHVPRYLRCSQDVAISRLSLQQAEQRVGDIWAAKAMSELAGQSPLSLQAFLYQYLHAESGKQSTLAAAGYSLLHACQTHASTSAPISLFLQVLSGRLPEAAHRDFERMLGCVAEVLLLLDGSVKEGVETTVAMPDLEHTLQTLFPHKSREQLQQLLPGGDADGQVDVSSLMPLARATTSWPYTPFITALLQQFLADMQARTAAVVGALEQEAQARPEQSVREVYDTIADSLPARGGSVAWTAEGIAEQLVGIQPATCGPGRAKLVKVQDVVDKVQTLGYVGIQGYYDAGAAFAWVQKLQASDAGASSAAGLPDVA